MSFTIIRSLVLVTLGVFVAAHALVLWARRRGTIAELAPAFGIGLGSAAVGIAVDGTGVFASTAVLAALALLVVALLAIARRHSRASL